MITGVAPTAKKFLYTAMAKSIRRPHGFQNILKVIIKFKCVFAYDYEFLLQIIRVCIKWKKTNNTTFNFTDNSPYSPFFMFHKEIKYE